MTDVLAAFGSWPFVANIWFLTAVAAVGLLAFLRHSPLARRFLPARDAGSGPSRFERFWSRRDGRLVAFTWIVLVALTIGDGGLVWSDSWEPVKVFFAILQPLAGVLLVPMTAALYLYKRSVPQVARDESDEREREIQGSVYRRVHALLVGSVVVAAGLLIFNPAIGRMIANTVSSRGVEPLDVVIPVFLVLYMLPSVAYAWMLPHHQDESPDGGPPVALVAGGEAG
jgi:hypothetical protein